jgi:hypothetical protein
MIKRVLLAVILLAGGTGFGFAEDTGSVSPHAALKKAAHQRIVKLIDRIENQRQRIDQDLAANTLTLDQAQSCRAVLDTVVSQMKAEQKANGAKKTMSKDQYTAYNASLDANSKTINEEKQYFYYYGPYADSGPYYDYQYNNYPVDGAPDLTVTPADTKYPRIFELKERIANQSERITEGLNDNTLTADQAAACRDVLTTLQNQMKSDYQADGSRNMTREQYDAYNTSLDANSVFLREEKQPYYYYDSYYDKNYYWD